MVVKKDTSSDDIIPPAPPGPEAPSVSAEPATDSAASDDLAKALENHAGTVIRTNMYLAAATGVIPFTYVDTAALIVVQLKMLKELSEVYGVSFRGDIGRSAVGALLGSVAPKALAGGVLGSGLLHMALSSFPMISAGVRFATMPVFGGAFTYALGKVFQMHFASGGTFLTFDATAVKDYFVQTFNAARNRKPAAETAVAA